MSDEKPIWTDQDDADLGYGQEAFQDANAFLAEIKKLYPLKQAGEIWPNWTERVPNKFHFRVSGDPFLAGNVRHRSNPYWIRLDLEWIGPYSLGQLRDDPRYLPGNYSSEWSGVYRIFARSRSIDRCCGKDPTGTLYIGCAASRGRNWSILRTRIQSILREDHHAMQKWRWNDSLHKSFPKESLFIEWAYTGTRIDHTGKTVQNVSLSENLLLSAYSETYGEYPPWNEKG